VNAAELSLRIFSTVAYLTRHRQAIGWEIDETPNWPGHFSDASKRAPRLVQTPHGPQHGPHTEGSSNDFAQWAPPT